VAGFASIVGRAAHTPSRSRRARVDRLRFDPWRRAEGNNFDGPFTLAWSRASSSRLPDRHPDATMMSRHLRLADGAHLHRRYMATIRATSGFLVHLALTFSMLMLVMSNNFLQLSSAGAVGWCPTADRLLVQAPTAIFANLKAFWSTASATLASCSHRARLRSLWNAALRRGLQAAPASRQDDRTVPARRGC